MGGLEGTENKTDRTEQKTATPIDPTRKKFGRIGSRRVANMSWHFSDFPPPNGTCHFHGIPLSSIDAFFRLFLLTLS
jgi:hypothetical protein